MAWTTPALLTTGYRIRDTDWNNQIAENFKALDQHGHTGSPGDGAALAVPIPLPHQPLVANSAALINVFSKIFTADPFNINGGFHLLYAFLASNTSGSGKNYDIVADYGGTTCTVNTGTLATGTTNKLYIYRFWLTNNGTKTGQFLAGTLDTAASPSPNTVTTAAIDTTIVGTQLLVGIRMSAANANTSFEMLQGYYIGPSSSA